MYNVTCTKRTKHQSCIHFRYIVSMYSYLTSIKKIKQKAEYVYSYCTYELKLIRNPTGLKMYNFKTKRPTKPSKLYFWKFSLLADFTTTFKAGFQSRCQSRQLWPICQSRSQNLQKVGARARIGKNRPELEFKSRERNIYFNYKHLSNGFMDLLNSKKESYFLLELFMKVRNRSRFIFLAGALPNLAGYETLLLLGAKNLNIGSLWWLQSVILTKRPTNHQSYINSAHIYSIHILNIQYSYLHIQDIRQSILWKKMQFIFYLYKVT